MFIIQRHGDEPRASQNSTDMETRPRTGVTPSSRGGTGVEKPSVQRQRQKEGEEMTFDDLLAQVLTLLQQQGRISYGALKRRFGLDDAYLDDLKAELIDALRLAVDEDGGVLVWTGTADAPPVLPSASSLSPARQDVSSPPGP